MKHSELRHQPRHVNPRIQVTSRHVYRMFREFVDFMATLRYEPCTQFINVSQRALHIYFIDGCHRIKSKTKTATCEQAPRSLFLF